jgi:hypothetical protein
MKTWLLITDFNGIPVKRQLRQIVFDIIPVYYIIIFYNNEKDIKIMDVKEIRYYPSLHVDIN